MVPSATASTGPGASSPLPSLAPSRGYAGTFSSTGSLGTARWGQTATLLNDGRVLIAGGEADSGTTTSAELYDPKDGTFSPTGSMKVARSSTTATLLSDGRVLIAGGFDGAKDIASAELYDVTTGKFTSTGSLKTARESHTAALLPDGRVLIAGGEVYSSNAKTQYLASAEVYDPKSGTFSATGSMSAARKGHTATSLSDGRVLVAGGWGDSLAVASAEIYDPTTGKFSATGSMSTARDYHSATLLTDGRVLIAGGWDGGDVFTSAELYDPKTGIFSATGSMATGRFDLTAARLTDGRVLIAGGFPGLPPSSAGDWPATASAEVYDPATGRFSRTGSMSGPRSWHTATALADGRVLIVGGTDGAEDANGYLSKLASAELY
jgi:WD40 repeat protein